MNITKSIQFLSIAVGFGAAALPSRAGEAAVSVRAFAQDSSLFLTGEQSFSSPAGFQSTASETALYKAGLARSYSHVDASAFTGAIHADFQAAVDDNRYIVGRNAFATGAASLTGSITLSDGYPPGIATFSAVLEGSYNFSNSIFKYLNEISLNFSAAIGDTGEKNGTMAFDPFTTAGLFSIPMTWTQEVHAGQKIDMYFYLKASVSGLVDAVELNALNTFKLTSIALPQGYSYTSDAEGFLSEFGTPPVVTPPPVEPPVTPPTSAVPEPSTYGLFCALGLFAIMAKRRLFK
jgi:hypothetical protein